MARRRKRFADLGKIPVSLDAFLPPLVGGGATMGTTLLLRGVVGQYKKDDQGNVKLDEQGKPIENVAFKYAGLFGAIPGVVLSAVLGPFTGWGSAISSALTSIFTGLTAQLYNTVPSELHIEKLPEQKSGYGVMFVRKPVAQIRAPERLGYKALITEPVKKELPENVSVFPPKYVRTVNASAWGGRTY